MLAAMQLMMTIDCDTDDDCSCSCASECSCSCSLFFLRSALHVQRWRCALAAMPLMSIQKHNIRYIAHVGCIPPKAGARNRTHGAACSRAGPATQRILRPSATRSGRALPKRAQPMSACACRTALLMAILRHASCFLSNSNFFFSVFKPGTSG